MRRKNLSNANLVSASTIRLLLIIVCIGVIAVFFMVVSKRVFQKKTTRAYTEEILARCPVGDLQASCFQTEIVHSTQKLSLRESFAVMKGIQERFPFTMHCHDTGHKLADRALKKDRTNWQTLFRECPNDMCSSGCRHGILQGYFRSPILTKAQEDEVIPALADTCKIKDKWIGTDLEIWDCLHSMGHVAVYIAGGDIPRATGICNRIGELGRGVSDTRICTMGVFMQVFLAYEPEALAMVSHVRPDKEHLVSYCETFSPLVRPICILEGWPLYSEEVQTGEGLFGYCSLLTQYGAENECIERVAAEVITIKKMRVEEIKSICEGLPSNLAVLCFSGVAKSMMTIDTSLLSQAADVCGGVPDAAGKTTCYERLLATSIDRFGKHSSEYARLCTLVAQKQGGVRCDSRQ